MELDSIHFKCYSVDSTLMTIFQNSLSFRDLSTLDYYFLCHLNRLVLRFHLISLLLRLPVFLTFLFSINNWTRSNVVAFWCKSQSKGNARGDVIWNVPEYLLKKIFQRKHLNFDCKRFQWLEMNFKTKTLRKILIMEVFEWKSTIFPRTWFVFRKNDNLFLKNGHFSLEFFLTHPFYHF